MINFNLLINPQIYKNLIATLIYLLVAVCIKIIADKLIDAVITKINDKDAKESKLEQRVKTIKSVLQNAVSITITGIATTMLFSLWGVDIAPLLAGAGVVGLAIGFGSQALVKDIVTGFFILFENQFNVGDTIEASGKKGRVQAINLRTTIIIGEDETKYIIPNSSITMIAKFKNS